MIYLSVMDGKTLLGFAAAFCTTVAFVPQAIRTIKTKNTESISGKMYFIFTLGTLMWTAYGILTRNLPVILANIVTTILAFIILCYKLRATNKNSQKYRASVPSNK
jgi:MtN3 and saliva related transmembrane protein